MKNGFTDVVFEDQFAYVSIKFCFHALLRELSDMLEFLGLGREPVADAGVSFMEEFPSERLCISNII